MSGSLVCTASPTARLVMVAAAPVVVSLRHTAAAERKERVKKEKKAQGGNLAGRDRRG